MLNKKINRKNKCLSEYIHDFIIEIRKPTYMTPFKNPVDPNEIPHYYEVIKNPMDLSTMYQKLLDGRYQFLSEVKADIQLIITNCETFNPENTWIRPLCDKFKSNFEKSWVKLQETLERKGIDQNKALDKLPEMDENKNELPSIWLPDSLGLRTRNQVSIIKEGNLNESIYSNDIKDPKEMNMNTKINLGISREASSLEPFNKIEYNPPNFLVQSFPNHKEIQNFVSEENYYNPQDIPNIKKESSFILTPKISNEIMTTNIENQIVSKEPKNEIPVSTKIIEEMNNNFRFSKEISKDIDIPQEIQMPNETENNPNMMEIEEEKKIELIIELDLDEIKLEFKEYSLHKLRKYKKIVLKGLSKIFLFLTGFEKNPENLDFLQELNIILKEFEAVKGTPSIDYNQICLNLIRCLFWLKKNSPKIKDVKTNKRIMAYFSCILKALRRINSLSKRIKTLAISISEDIFQGQDLGLAYFREHLHKIQSIFYPPPPPKLIESNSIKITLPKPPPIREKLENETTSTIIKPPKKFFHEKLQSSSPMNTKIVLNKNLKSLSLEKPAPTAENKSDKMFSWVSSFNQKIHDKLDGYLQGRLNISNNEINIEKEEKLNLIVKQSSLENQENMMFEERKNPIMIVLPKQQSYKNINVFNESDDDDEKYDELGFLKEEIDISKIQIIKKNEDVLNNNYFTPQSIKNIKFKEIFIEKEILVKMPLMIMNNNNIDTLTKVTIEEISIYSLFKEIDEDDKNFFDDLVKNLKRNHNERLKYNKNDRIVDKTSKCLLEISQEITLDKIIKIAIKLKNINDFIILVTNLIHIESFELFIDLKRVQKINELNLVENSSYFTYDVLSRKLMKNMLYDALLNQLIKVSKFQIDREAGIYYCVDKIPNENNGYLLVIWSAVNKFMDFKLSLNEIKLL